MSSQALYGAQVWADLMKTGDWAILAKCQRKVLLRVASAYRTVSTNALYVITGIPPIKLTAEERKVVFDAKDNNVDIRAALQEATESKMRTWHEDWEKADNGEWTREADKKHSSMGKQATRSNKLSSDPSAVESLVLSGLSYIGSKKQIVQNAGIATMIWTMRTIQYLSATRGTPNEEK